MKPPIRSVLDIGSAGLVVEIECQLSNGLPSIVIVGLGNRAVDEAKERVRSAFTSTGLLLPRKRITINLAPADIPKDSTSLDLAIAAAILQASESAVPAEFSNTQAFIGEIGLDGSVRPVRGIIGKLLAGQRAGLRQFFVPKANEAQALLVPGIKIMSLESIADLTKPVSEHVARTDSPPATLTRRPAPTFTLSGVAGQMQAKRALLIAAAGGHNIFLYGAPGTGKSMLAKCLPGLLPPLVHREMLEVTHIHSRASHKYDELITTRPFRSPHNSSSGVAILGGGPSAQPGEITLAHHGVLFLDELPEFSRQILESLRQPLEDKYVTISRSRHVVRYPAHFMLVATANPCPCGYHGSDTACRCTPYQVNRYQQKISGPILDRIDLHVSMHPIDHAKLLQPSGLSDKTAHQTIALARSMQQQRYGPGDMLNSTMGNTDIQASSHIEGAARAFLSAAAKRLRVSARSFMKTITVARTIADMEASQTIKIEHVSEALQYRPKPPPP